MKKNLLKVFFVSCLMVLTFTLASCGATPKFDLEKAAENLERRDYRVYYEDDYDEDEPYYKESLYASKSGESVSIMKFNDLRTAKLYYKALKLEHESGIKELKLQIRALQWEKLRYAGKLDSDQKEDLQEEIDELKDELEEAKKEVSYGRIGNIVWYGTEEAIKDTK